MSVLLLLPLFPTPKLPPILPLVVLGLSPEGMLPPWVMHLDTQRENPNEGKL